MWKSFCSSFLNMFDFGGRERRRGFWFTVFFSIMILSAVLAAIGVTVLVQTITKKSLMIGKTAFVVYEQGLFALVSLVLYFPIVSCAVRRLHDVNVSGLLLAVPVVNVILLSLPSSLKEKKQSPGFVHGLGQTLALLVFIFATGFSVLAFLSRSTDGDIPFFNNGAKEETLGEKALKEIEENKKDEEKKLSQKENGGEIQNGQKDIHLLDAGAVIVPIHDTRKFNYIRIGDESMMDGSVVTQYKHVQSLNIDFLSNTEIYDTFDGQTVIGNVNLGEEYTVLSLYQITYPQINDYTGKFWLEIAYGNGAGYINAGSIDNPYRNDNYIPLEQIQIGNKIWTVRRFDSMFSFYHQIDIRDYPGMEATNVIGRIDANLNNMVTVSSDAITEQDDTSEGPIGGEPWIRIEYNGITGWIPGAYTDIEHGGVKYQTPDGILKNDLGFGF
ncbi:MAG: DUF805 domain-containing protein [Treponema sp.]|nr:DUF805 domain-containing protein [Treponema sp.]